MTCCHKTRLLDAPCPVGRQCPYDVSGYQQDILRRSQEVVGVPYGSRPTEFVVVNEEGSFVAHLPIRTPPEPTPDHRVTNWSA